MRFRHLAAPAGIFLLAYVVRLVFLFEIAASPFFDFLHLDPLYYHDWAKEIAAGDWIGSEVFEMSPLYSYLLAVFMMIFGDDLWLLRLLQIGAGGFTCVLTWALAKRLFGGAAGVAAGIGCALYGPFLFYEGQVMKEFLTPPLATGALLLVVISRDKEPAHRFFLMAGAGALLALASLVRDNILVALAALGLWALLAHPGRWRAAAWMAAGAALVLTPVALRNAAVGGELVLTTSGGGEVFYIGNSPYANGAYVPPPWVRSNPRFEHDDFRTRARELTGRPLTRGEASRFWWRQGLAWIAENPPRAARLWLRKMALFWNDHELPDNYSFYTFRRFSTVLAWSLTFGPVAALAWAGAALTSRDRRRLAPLYVAAFAYMISVVIFFNFARFRLPMVPVLLAFAGAAVVGLARALHSTVSGARPARREALAGILLVVMLPFVFIDWSTAYEEPFQDRLHLGAAYRQAGRLEEAETTLRQVVADAEAVVRRHGGDPSHAATTPGGVTFALALSAAHRDLAGVLTDRGRHQEAVRELEAAAALNPKEPDPLIRLGAARRAAGDLSGAAEASRRAAALNPRRFDAWFDLATALYEMGSFEEALQALDRAREAADPKSAIEMADWHYGMGAVLHSMPGREAEAAAHLKEALTLNPQARQAEEVREVLREMEAAGASSRR